MPDQLTESLGRLSKKAGVLATIVLDRATGAILKTTGTLSTETGVIPALTTPAATAEAAGLGERNGISDIALMAWNIVNAAGGLIHGLDNEVICHDTG
jgi:dynein light chain roadblock-type